MAADSQVTAGTASRPAIVTFQLPLVYRLFFLVIEPLATFAGAFYCFFKQKEFLDMTHPESSPSSPIPLGTSVITAQLGNCYLLFALNEAVTLRCTSDLRVWKVMLFCFLVADLSHFWTVKPLGIYFDVGSWSAAHWGYFGLMYVAVVLRVAFLLGVGLGGGSKVKKTA
ncbi:hypothetical protein VTJ04DRAFT_4014 [Mycothermus thermophilus]|uniref:uncharacterized protein n=1 Tax=Humicola insolens TaxID=85995 RepID=UPI00374470B7